MKDNINEKAGKIIEEGRELLVSYEAEELRGMSYTKVNKLITALYMVTDIMDKNEPIRHRLRGLGSGIISDIFYLKGHVEINNKINNRISEILSFLGIASQVEIISEMNKNILVREFIELKKSISDYITSNSLGWLEGLIEEENDKTNRLRPLQQKGISKGHGKMSIGQGGTRIGVQKGATLMKALSDRFPGLSRTKDTEVEHKNKSFELKEERRKDIIFSIKDKQKNSTNFNGATITDIKSVGHGSIASCGEKTLQRELVSMVLDGILRKTGEKRWSRYFLN